MAVESEPVTTNLDRFPPGSRKRKSEPATQKNSSHKRARSSQMQRSARDVDDPTTKASSEPAASKVGGEEPMMVTRRSKRQSTRISLSPPQSEQAILSDTSERIGPNIREAEDQATIDVADRLTTSTTLPRSTALKQTPKVAASAVPKPHDELAHESAPIATSSATRVSAKATPVSSSNISGKRVHISNDDDFNVNGPQKSRKRAATPLDDDLPSDDYGDKEIRVDYFARVQLRTKVVEIPLMTKNLNKEAKVIEDYADFVERNDADGCSFGLYKGLLEDHGKKGWVKGKKK